MAYCPECGVEVGGEQEFCGECGSNMTPGESSADDSFIDRYGAEPLPLASARGEFIQIYGKIMGSIPLIGGLMKMFFGFGLWCYSINLKILRIITLGADVNDRLRADYDYLKDNLDNAYNGEAAPPDPP